MIWACVAPPPSQENEENPESWNRDEEPHEQVLFCPSPLFGVSAAKPRPGWNELLNVAKIHTKIQQFAKLIERVFLFSYRHIYSDKREFQGSFSVMCNCFRKRFHFTKGFSLWFLMFLTRDQA